MSVTTQSATRRLAPHVRRIVGDSLFRNSFGQMASTVLTGLLGYCFWIAAAHGFPTRDIGVAAALISAVTVASILGTAGLGNALVETLPACHDDEQWSQTLNAALLGATVGGTIIGIAAVFGLPPLSSTFDELRSPATALLFVTACGVWTAQQTLDNVFIAERASSGLVVRNVAGSLVKLPLLLVPIAVSRRTAFSLFSVWWVAAVLALLLGVLVLVPRSRGAYAFRPRATLRRLGSMRHSLVGHHLATVGSILPTWLMPVVVAARLPAQDTGYFFLTWMLAGLFFMISPAVSMSVFAEGSHDRASVQRAARRSTFFIAALLFVPAVAFVAGGHVILRAFGPGYPSHGYALLVVLVISAVPDAITNIAVAVMRVEGQLRRAATLNITMSVIALGGALVLLGPFGIAGAGIAWLVAQTLGALYVVVWARVPMFGRGTNGRDTACAS